jgi:hypothetical protein
MRAREWDAWIYKILKIIILDEKPWFEETMHAKYCL